MFRFFSQDVVLLSFSTVLFVSVIFYSNAVLPLACFTLFGTWLFIRIRKNAFLTTTSYFLVLALAFTVLNIFSHTEVIRALSIVILLFLALHVGFFMDRAYQFKVYIVFTLMSAIVFSYYFLNFLYNPIVYDGRAAYLAREFLVAGPYYDFNFGLTHLNMYFGSVITMSIFLLNIKGTRIIGIILIIICIVVTFYLQSRGPLLLIILLLSLVNYEVIKQKLGKRLTLMLCLIFSALVLIVLAPVLWSYLKSVGHAGGNRLLTAGATDLSRLVFFAAGVDDLISAPFGNISVYSSGRLLDNYHNTFLSLANRWGVVPFVVLMMLLGRSIVNMWLFFSQSNTVKAHTYFFIYLTFFLMIEDVTRFDRGILIMWGFTVGALFKGDSRVSQ
jgi:hypothetical protein